jgi:hypothetical protein
MIDLPKDGDKIRAGDHQGDIDLRLLDKAALFESSGNTRFRIRNAKPAYLNGTKQREGNDTLRTNTEIQCKLRIPVHRYVDGVARAKKKIAIPLSVALCSPHEEKNITCYFEGLFNHFEVLISHQLKI